MIIMLNNDHYNPVLQDLVGKNQNWSLEKLLSSRLYIRYLNIIFKRSQVRRC